MRFRDRHQDPDSTDLEYGARVNGFGSVTDFIEHLAGNPWIVTMLGFVPGLPFCYQLEPRERQVEVPKYVRPRTFTPERAFGIGGAFSVVYPVQGAGGYQFYGIAPAPVLNVYQDHPDFADSIVFPDRATSGATGRSTGPSSTRPARRSRRDASATAPATWSSRPRRSCATRRPSTTRSWRCCTDDRHDRRPPAGPHGRAVDHGPGPRTPGPLRHRHAAFGRARPLLRPGDEPARRQRRGAALLEATYVGPGRSSPTTAASR